MISGHGMGRSLPSHPGTSSTQERGSAKARKHPDHGTRQGTLASRVERPGDVSREEVGESQGSARASPVSSVRQCPCRPANQALHRTLDSAGELLR
jgi:hypothetical protein